MNEASENNLNFDAISNCPNITTTRGSRGNKFSNNLSIFHLSNDQQFSISSSLTSTSFSTQPSSNSSSITNERSNKRHANDNKSSNIEKKPRNYSCLVCHKPYTYLGALLTHLKNAHDFKADEINAFQETVLEKSLISSSQDKAKLIESKEKAPFACEFCSRIFKGEKWLTNHIATEHCRLIDSPHLTKIHIPNATTSLESSFYSSYTANDRTKTNSKSKQSKSCNVCNKKYIRKHTCKKKGGKLAENENRSDLAQAFNFSQDFFTEDFDKFRFDPQKLLENNEDFFNSNNNWLDQHQFFAQKNSSKFKILHINVNSIFCKFYDLDSLLRKNLYDIVFVQESKLGPITPDSFISNDSYYL